jgi:hypothetical protein
MGCTSVRDSVGVFVPPRADSAVTTSDALANRSFGAFARHRMTTASIAESTAGARARRAGAGSRAMATMAATGVVPEKARAPASIS